MSLWKLNALEMGNSLVKVDVISHSHDMGVRQGTADLHGATEYRERLGKDLPRLSLTFSFIGTDASKFTELEWIQTILEDDAVWTLEAPATDAGITTYLDSKRAALSTSGVSVKIVNRARVDVKIDAIVNGIWIGDGGTYCEQVGGNFELTSTGPSVYTRDDGTVTGATPLVRLPKQSPGYPLAVRASDYALIQPTKTATFVTTDADGQTIIYEDYDFTGFIIPAPTVAGDVGLYQVCSSPAADFLGANFPASNLDTLSFNEMAAVCNYMAQGASTLDVFAFADATAVAALMIAGATTLDSLTFDDIGATSTLLAPLLTETGEVITTEAGEDLLVQA